MSKAFVCFRGGKPLPLSCSDSASTERVSDAQAAQWKKDLAIVEAHEAASVTTQALEARFGMKHRGTVTMDMDLANTKAAPDGSRSWQGNKDFVDHQRRKGNPVLRKYKDYERTAKEG